MGVLEIENKISDFAYFENEELTQYSVDKSVTSIGFSAFANVKNLTDINFQNNLKTIGECAFMNTNIKTLELPSTLKKIGGKAFSGCTKLKKVIIPEGVTSIGTALFADCTNLEEVYLPNSLKSLPSQLFLNCKNLKKIHLPEGITDLPDELFKGCEKLDVEIPASIKSIGQGTFNKCKNLTSYPEHVESVGAYSFKGCKKLTKAVINENIDTLPDHIFDGCINLREVIIKKPTKASKATFRNCISLTNIPENITDFGNFCFENCKGLKIIEVNTSFIPKGCFRGCINLEEINNFENVKKIREYALSNTGLKEIDLSNFRDIPANLLSYSKNLKIVKMDYAREIHSHAFYKCPKLQFELPEHVEKIDDFAFAYNKGTSTINLPLTLKDFKASAFSFSNIEKIKCFGNANYTVLDDVLVVKNFNKEIVLYAMGNKQEEFDISKFVEYGNTIDPIFKLGKYSFAGAKNLKSITIPSTINDIDVKTFIDNPNLKNLTIKTVDLYPSISMNFIKDGRTYLGLDNNLQPDGKKYEWPFEKLVISGKLVYLQSSIFALLSNTKDISFDSDSFTIGTGSFNLNKLEKVFLPEGVWNIGNNAFPKDCILDLGNGVTVKNITLMTVDHDQTYKYRLFILEDNSYLVVGNGNYVHLSEENMKKFTILRNDLIERKPTLFLDYFYLLTNNDLVDQEILRSGVLMGASKSVLNDLFTYYQKNDEFFINVLKYSGLLEQNDEYTDKILKDEEGFIKFINYVELLRKYNVDNPILYSRIFASECNLDDMEIILEFYSDLLIKILRKSKILNFNPDEENDSLRYSITEATFLIKDNNLLDYIFLLLKYNYRDSFLFNPEIIGISKTKFADKFFDNYDNNLKRLLISAGVINSKNVNVESSILNLEDLINLIYILGGFEENPITKQKALTFITEKMTMDYKDKKNTRKVIANDIHRIFNFSKIVRDEFDLEFANFFLENYDALYDKEINNSGFIERVYDNFRKISETSSSSKGIQRHLKVTMDKVVNFFYVRKFSNVPKRLKSLAAFIGEWYDKQEIWEYVLTISKEMKNSPRNIFVSPIIDPETKDQKYDNDEEKDLIENSSDKRYYYEWLPKNSYDNFILGKYCNCCAHLDGAGAGIMRASIILDNVQNLVIKNETGRIVAKSTLYVNKEKGYGVFNNVEVSLSITEEKASDLKLIYEAFMRGATAFVETYNENFDIKINELTVGGNRNRIAFEFEKNEHKEVPVKQAINYGLYSLRGHYGHYQGDSSYKQILVLKNKGGKA